MDEQGFADLVAGVQQGDEAATARLVAKYEPQLRRYVRYRLINTRMRNLVDSLDISQSVFARLFSGLTEGRLEVAEPKQLIKLLTTMAGNRINDHIRQQTAHKRAHERIAGDPQEVLAAVPAQTIDVVDAIANAELLDLLRAELGPEDRRVLDARLRGNEWHEIAMQIAMEEPTSDALPTAEALRKRLTRAIDAAASHLGIASLG
jgi:RNA polymerase sigma factor (sigma-70 family)